MVVIRDPVLALDFDLAATARLLEAERKALAGDGLNVEETMVIATGTKEINW